MHVFRRCLPGWTWKDWASLCGAGTLLVLFVWSEGLAQPRPPRRGPAKTVRGTVQSFTKAPMGEIDGAVLKDGTVIHWPPHLEDRATSILSKGDRIRVTGWMETTPDGDTHLEARTITKLSSGKSVRLGDRPPPPRRGPRALARRRVADEDADEDEDAKTVTGTVRSFTKAPKGEVDGAELSDGSVIHWPPHLEDKVTDVVKKGDKIKVTGRMETGPEGDTHLEAQTITNLSTDATVDIDDGPPRRGPARAAERGDREERLRALEDRLEELLKEVKRLRRDK